MATTFQTFRAFNAPLSVRYYPKAKEVLGKDYWMVINPFVYYVGAKGSNITVEIPAGYLCDGASIPPGLPNWIRQLLPIWGKHGQATVVHDRLCEYLTVNLDGQPFRISRERADDIFLEAMTVLEVPIIRKYVMYMAVCAWTRYNNITQPKLNTRKLALEKEYREFNHTPTPTLPNVSISESKTVNVTICEKIVSEGYVVGESNGNVNE